MNRLYSGLRAHGVDARIICRDRTQSESVQMPARPWVEKPLRRLTRRMGLNELHLVSSFAARKLQEFLDADLIDFHCLHCETLSYLALPGLTRGKPAVFTFHDMWPLTGHCHASLECDRWKTGCGQCPHLDVEPRALRDATALEWRLKRMAYNHSKFTIVTPSKWLHDRTKESMLGEFPVHHIPHGIETDIYQPLDKDHCRSLLGIPEGNNVILCAMESMKRPLKGAALLVAALQGLPDSVCMESVLLLFGQSNGEILKQIQMPVVNLGFLHNQRLKAMAFSAADVFINPTRAENFPLVVLESMACGTPVVSFGVGGVPEMVRPGMTGYLAQPDQPDDLCEGVVRLLGDKAGLQAMGRQCREVVLSEYALELQVQRYIDLYQQVIDGRA
ncbi:MAG: glycosyltransferase [Verrucomicrobiota bacterium]